MTTAKPWLRLRAAGYDAVEVRQPGEINHEIGGAQLVVFDPADVEVIR